MGGPVHIAHGDRHSGGAAGDVDGEQLAGSAVALVEHLPGGSDGGQLGDRLLVREPPGSAAEGPDGDGAVETAGAVEEVAPGPGSRFERGDLGDEGGLRAVEQDPVRAVAGPARQTVVRPDDLGEMVDGGLPLHRREAVPPGDEVATRWR